MPQAVKKKQFGLITVLMLIITGSAIVALLLAYLAFHVNPETLPWLAIAGLAYPFILLLMLVLTLFWIFYRIKLAIIPIVFILLGWNHVNRFIVFQSGTKSDTIQDAGVKVVSYNIQNFLKVNTSTTRWVTDFENEKKINQFLSDQKPDILCLQEMLNDRSDQSDFVKQFGKTLDCKYSYYQNYFKTKAKKIDALATFSRYPIVQQGSFSKDDKTFGLFTDLKINKDTIRVYNVHLASIHFREEDYQFWSDMDIQQEQEKLKSGTRKILNKMKLAYIKRSHQVLELQNHMIQSPYPIIICGDFNDTPNSFTYRILSKDKIDAHLDGGSGMGTTYAGRQFPAFRIDYIFYDSKLKGLSYQKHHVDYSDHYPISCRIQIEP